MPAFLGGRQLIFEVHGRGAGANQRLGQLECVEIAAETGFRVGDDGNHPVDVGLAVHVMNLIGAQQRIVDALDHFRHRVHGIQALIGVDFSGGIGVPGHLPTRAVNRLQPRLHRLNGLISGHAAQAGDHGLAVQLAPELLRAQTSQGVLDVHGAAQPRNVGRAVGTLDSGPTVGGFVAQLNSPMSSNSRELASRDAASLKYGKRGFTH